MTVSNDGITGQGSALPGAKFVFPGFEVALRWLWCGFGVALVWLWCGFGVALVGPWWGHGGALGWLCTPESMPSICLVYGFAVALGGLYRSIFTAFTRAAASSGVPMVMRR